MNILFLVWIVYCFYLIISKRGKQDVWRYEQLQKSHEDAMKKIEDEDFNSNSQDLKLWIQKKEKQSTLSIVIKIIFWIAMIPIILWLIGFIILLIACGM